MSGVIFCNPFDVADKQPRRHQVTQQRAGGGVIQISRMPQAAVQGRQGDPKIMALGDAQGAAVPPCQ